MPTSFVKAQAWPKEKLSIDDVGNTRYGARASEHISTYLSSGEELKAACQTTVTM